MTEEKLAEILKLLLDKTLSGEITWEQGVNDKEFVTPFADLSVGIRGPEGNVDLAIYNEMGAVIETFDQTTANRFELYTHLEDLLLAARRNSLGVDKALDSILTTLRVSTADRKK
jgi:hypothetical protein